MSSELLNRTDTTLPTVNNDLKEVFPDSPLDSNSSGLHLLSNNTAQQSSYESLADLDMASLVDFLNPPVVSSMFSIIPSKKERGKPYFIDPEGRILTTKRNEPIHLKLDNCKPGQKILLTLRYSDEDFYDHPMICNGCSHSYKGCSSSEDHNGANFCVRSRDGAVNYTMRRDGNYSHPTAEITVFSKHGDADLFVAFKCRNSCSEHKKYGSDRTLQLMLLDEQENQLCRNEWNLRVCESAKRDHNLVLSKAGTSRIGSTTTASALLYQPSAVPSPAVPSPAVPSDHVVTQGQASDTAFQPPLTKRIKLEEDPIVHYIDASSDIVNQQMAFKYPMIGYAPSSPPAFNSAGGNSHKNSIKVSAIAPSNFSGNVGSGCSLFTAKQLCPIAPPASAVAEAAPPAEVVPVLVYPKTEADKKLLKAFAERLDMSIFNVHTA